MSRCCEKRCASRKRPAPRPVLPMRYGQCDGETIMTCQLFVVSRCSRSGHDLFGMATCVATSTQADNSGDQYCSRSEIPDENDDTCNRREHVFVDIPRTSCFGRRVHASLPQLNTRSALKLFMYTVFDETMDCARSPSHSLGRFTSTWPIPGYHKGEYACRIRT